MKRCTAAPALDCWLLVLCILCVCVTEGKHPQSKPDFLFSLDTRPIVDQREQMVPLGPLPLTGLLLLAAGSAATSVPGLWFWGSGSNASIDGIEAHRVGRRHQAAVVLRPVARR